MTLFRSPSARSHRRPPPTIEPSAAPGRVEARQPLSAASEPFDFDRLGALLDARFAAHAQRDREAQGDTQRLLNTKASSNRFEASLSELRRDMEASSDRFETSMGEMRRDMGKMLGHLAGLQGALAEAEVRRVETLEHITRLQTDFRTYSLGESASWGYGWAAAGRPDPFGWQNRRGVLVVGLKLEVETQ